MGKAMKGSRAPGDHRPAPKDEPSRKVEGPGRGHADPASRKADARPGGRKPGAFSVVALGASAGGLEALEQFVAGVPRDAGVAFVVVQHLERRHPSLLADLLARHTPIPVRQAADGDTLEPDRIFVIPPNALLQVKQGILRVLPPGDDPRMPIDTFFRSLAEDRGELAVGVLLSGTGTDGTFGLRAIKEQGGLTLAQEPETARHPSMPQTAIAAGFVDEVLAAARMPARVLEHAELSRRSPRGGVVLEAEVREALPKICALLRRSTGHDFGRYKEGTLLRRTRRRIQLLRLESTAEYLERLEKDPEEPGLLLKDLLIGVTQFFREPPAFEALAEKAIARLIEDGSADRPIRIWVPGCATGEEAYSIAILVHEQLAAMNAARTIQLFATDIDSEALARARTGRYRADVAEQVSPERLDRFFRRIEEGYQIVKELREMCVFSAHNLIRDPPFSSLDLISCRNVLIYLEPDLQRKVVPLLHYALRRSGFLFLGSSEELAGQGDLFTPLDKKHRIFQRKETLVRPALDFPAGGPPTSRSMVAAPAAEPSVRNHKLSVLQSFERMLLEEYAPASAVVDERGEMLCLGGNRGALLQAPTGLVTNNVFDHAEGTLRHALRTALGQAVARAEVVRREIAAEVGGGLRRVRVTVCPAPAAPAQSGLYAVVVEDLGAAHVPGAEGSEALSQEPVIEQLESELKTTRADLQAANEELEGAIEELKSSNEELLSTNEELQSANEELQTSKEELQSLNEELETVNAELRQKVSELGVANSDLQNLFASTQVATIFLDRERKLAKFTPAATTLFRFIDPDIGRPLADLAPRFAGTDLLADVDEVLHSLVPVEREVRAGEAWFILRVLPYRTLDDAIAGAVVTFADVTKLKRAEAALRQGERLLKDVIDGSPSIVFLKDLQGRFLTINKRLEALLGTTREELRGKTDYDLFPPGRAEYYRAHDRQVAESRGPLDVEEVADLHDGHHVFLASKFPLLDAAGRIYGVGAISHDITERKRAEELVRRYAGLLRLSQDAVLVCVRSGTIEYWNRGAETLYGFGEQEALGKDVNELLQTRFPEPASDLDEVLARDGHWEGEVAQRSRDGRTVAVSVRMQLVRGDDGLERVLQTNQDVTQRKRAEESLRESEERYRALFENASDAILVTDPNGQGRVLSANPAACRMFGYAADEIVGLDRDALLDAGDPELADALKQREAQGAAVAVLTYRRKDGTLFPGELATASFLDSSGHGRAVAIVRDITERRRAEEERRDLDQRKSDFLAMLSHELRNPLAPIRNSLYILGHGEPDAERARRARSVMERQVDHLVRLVDDLLDVTRITRGKMRLERERVNLSEIVDRTVEDHRVLFTGAGIELCLRSQPDLWIEGDRTRMAQVVGNLLQNAVKFTPRGGAVSVSLEGLGGAQATIRVRDTGTGIGPEVLPRLFEPFSQADRTLDRTKGGLGLGLALVKGLAELHGGTVVARSEGLGKGAEFEIVLPVVPARGNARAPAAGEAGAPVVAPRRVLIIEDNRDAADSLKELLELASHVTAVAYSADEGLKKARTFQPDLVLCDIGLPVMDGYQVARVLRADPTLGSTMLVALSGYAASEDVLRSRAAGFDQHLAKPPSIDALERVLEQSGRRIP